MAIFRRTMQSLIAAALMSAPQLYASGDESIDVPCPEIGFDPNNLHDYRARESTNFVRWSYRDNWNAHTRPAMERLAAGERSHRVMADLNFTLRIWPNHVPALLALTEYSVNGGSAFEFAPAECYFYNARRHFENDITVAILEGQMHWKRGHKRRAETAFKSALEINSQSVDAHYQLGLLYFEIGDFAQSLMHAQIAYELGYPLPGLRRKLEEAGRWQPETLRPAPEDVAGSDESKAQNYEYE